MPTLLETFLKFATLGMAVEIFFTAFTKNFAAYRRGEKINWGLEGHSYIWMFPIYGLVAFLAPVVIDPLQGLPFIVRWFLYAVVILIVEYITGYIIRSFTGRCPWHYDSGWQVHNLIRLDYTPAWMLFSAIVEYLYYNY